MVASTRPAPSAAFASDNAASVHPAILRAINEASSGYALAYGRDPWSARLEPLWARHFGPQARAFLVFGGTAANVLALRALVRPHEAVVCARGSHIEFDECGAVEAFDGCKLLPVTTDDGKLTPALLEEPLSHGDDDHHVQPRVLSLAQVTEQGTVYSLDELRTLIDFAHLRGLKVHMDGARLANAAAALDVTLGEVTAGVDVLSFGGTKNGLMFGEAVVFLDPGPARDFRYMRMQGMQLASKMRFLSAQFEALLSDDLWKSSAAHANGMARLLARRASTVPGVVVAREPQANGVFATLPRRAMDRLREDWTFHVWDESTNEVRWMCSFATTEDEIDRFVDSLRVAVGTL